MPVTPEQIALACLEATRAGASVVHIHVRDQRTGLNSRDPELFKEVVDRVRSAGQDIIVNLTCGHGAFFLPDPEDESSGKAASELDRLLWVDGGSTRTRSRCHRPVSRNEWSYP